ncbi:MAG: 50S ribosomal protein L1 [Candidatus Micrarchaeia archaeon]
MAISREQINRALGEALADKGKRKFTQSLEFILNFKGVDFGKPDKRLNLEVALPNGKGKVPKIAVFADGQLALDAKKDGADLVLAGADIPKLAADKPRLKQLMRDHEFLAAPQLMMQVGKSLGQAMGPKDKLPKPVMGGKLGELIEKARRTVKLKTKGKNLPTVQCIVGNENMPVEQLAENIEAVLEAVKAKLGGENIASAFVKLTMGKPARIS